MFGNEILFNIYTLGMKMINFIGGISLLLVLLACGNSPATVEPVQIPQDWSTYANKDYSIQYPNTWDLNKSGEMGTSFVIYSSQDSKQDPFKENVNLMLQKFPGQEISLDEYTKISEDQIKKMLPNCKIQDSKRLISNDKNFHKLVYTGKQGIFNLKFEQYYWIENEKAYVLTLTCEEKEFVNYKSTGEKILNSFLIK